MISVIRAERCLLGMYSLVHIKIEGTICRSSRARDDRIVKFVFANKW